MANEEKLIKDLNFNLSAKNGKFFKNFQIRQIFFNKIKKKALKFEI